MTVVVVVVVARRHFGGRIQLRGRLVWNVLVEPVG